MGDQRDDIYLSVTSVPIQKFLEIFSRWSLAFHISGFANFLHLQSYTLLLPVPEGQPHHVNMLIIVILALQDLCGYSIKKCNMPLWEINSSHALWPTELALQIIMTIVIITLHIGFFLHHFLTSKGLKTPLIIITKYSHLDHITRNIW